MVQLVCGPRSVCKEGEPVLAQRSARRRWLSAVEAVSLTRVSDFADTRLHWCVNDVDECSTRYMMMFVYWLNIDGLESQLKYDTFAFLSFQ